MVQVNYTMAFEVCGIAPPSSLSCTSLGFTLGSTW